MIQTGGGPTGLFDQPSTDADSVIRRLKQLRGGFGASQMQLALDEALATLSAMSNARRELVVISDFQPSDWDDVGLNAESIRQQCDAMDVRPRLDAAAHRRLDSQQRIGRVAGVSEPRVGGRDSS